MSEYDLTSPKIREASLDDHVVVDCPSCIEPMLLGKWWRELILEDGHDVPKCPGCSDPDDGDSWSDDAEPKMDCLEFHAIAGDVIRELDQGGGRDG